MLQPPFYRMFCHFLRAINCFLASKTILQSAKRFLLVIRFFFFASPNVNKNKKVTEITPITIQADRTIVTPNYNLHIAIRSDSNNSAIFAKYGLSPIHFHNCTCCVILPSISLHVQEICIIKFVIFPWFLHITTIKWKYLLTIFFFRSGGFAPFHAALSL